MRLGESGASGTQVPGGEDPAAAEVPAPDCSSNGTSLQPDGSVGSSADPSTATPASTHASHCSFGDCCDADIAIACQTDDDRAAACPRHQVRARPTTDDPVVACSCCLLRPADEERTVWRPADEERTVWTPAASLTETGVLATGHAPDASHHPSSAASLRLREPLSGVADARGLDPLSDPLAGGSGSRSSVAPSGPTEPTEPTHSARSAPTCVSPASCGGAGRAR